MGKQEIINIIAGGQSVKNMDIKEICRRAYTIGVNDSAVLAPVNIGVSMDRRWAQYREPEIKGKPFLLRKPPSTWPGVFAFNCDYETDEFSELPGKLNGRNSGYCALNLAYQMRPKKIYLFGYDFSGKPYWYPAYPWVKYPTERSRMEKEWPLAFDKARQYFDQVGIEIIIVGLESKLTQFKKISYEEYLNG